MRGRRYIEEELHGLTAESFLSWVSAASVCKLSPIDERQSGRITLASLRLSFHNAE